MRGVRVVIDRGAAALWHPVPPGHLRRWRLHFSSVAGTGVSPEVNALSSVGPGNLPIVVPDTLRSSNAPLALFGVNLEQRLADRFSVHGEVLLIGAEDASEYRVQAGFSVPLRPYSTTRMAVSGAYGRPAEQPKRG
jgi:hypothetical protein